MRLKDELGFHFLFLIVLKYMYTKHWKKQNKKKLKPQHQLPFWFQVWNKHHQGSPSFTTTNCFSYVHGSLLWFEDSRQVEDKRSSGRSKRSNVTKIHLLFSETSSDVIRVEGWLSKKCTLKEKKQGERAEVCQIKQKQTRLKISIQRSHGVRNPNLEFLVHHLSVCRKHNDRGTTVSVYSYL